MTVPIAQLLRTVRHLKPTQIAGQVHNRMRSLWERPERFAEDVAGDTGGCRWRRGVDFLPPGIQPNASSTLLAGSFQFLNRNETLGWPPADWNATGLPKLWQYNLHYFEWLWALEFESVREAILDWVERHPLGRGRVGWEPYPTSLRLMNWCGVCFGRFRMQTDADHHFSRVMRRSVMVQAEWLRRHIETHLLGNHILENGAALAFAGSAFTGPTADAWLAQGLDVLRREIAEQILPDGMHFERSPMYHIRMTYLMRMLLDTGNPALEKMAALPLAKMRPALAQLCHPDGEIALLNDSAFSIYNRPSELLGQEMAPPGPWALPDAGYYGYRGAAGSYILCDAGPIGPDYLPGHAHGDIFSFELSLKGQRLIVDSGVHDYEASPMRAYCRSTSAHNTVEIEGRDQCEFWGAFRVARRAYPRDVCWKPADGGFLLSAWHDGYRRLAGAPVHHREIAWESAGRLSVRDRITAKSAVSAVSRLHLHPRCSVSVVKDRAARVEYPGGACEIEFMGQGRLTTEQSFYCPEFGHMEANYALAFEFRGADVETGFILRSL